MTEKEKYERRPFADVAVEASTCGGELPMVFYPLTLSIHLDVKTQLCYVRDGYGRQIPWDKWADAVGLSQSHVASADVKFGDSAVLITAAIDGQGVVLARRLLVGDDLDAGRIVRLDATTIKQDRALYFVCRTGDQDRAAIRSLRNWLFSLRAREN